MDIITGYTGSPHVTAEQDRDVNIGIFGAESYVLRTGSRQMCIRDRKTTEYNTTDDAMREFAHQIFGKGE